MPIPDLPSGARDAAPDRVAARKAFRQEARNLVSASGQAGPHLARLAAALAMPGAEPAQGALADLFASFGADAAPLKRSALALVAQRLAPHVRQAFALRVDAGVLHGPTPLATRWSVLSQPSVDVPTRTRRSNPDASRALASAAVEALRQADTDAVAQFLEHCMTCQDKLAFMLARRALLKSGHALPPAWGDVAEALEHLPEAA